MNTRNPFECDEYPEKPCPECGFYGENDIVCRECGWTACMACHDKTEWVPVERTEDDLCVECSGKKINHTGKGEHYDRRSISVKE